MWTQKKYVLLCEVRRCFFYGVDFYQQRPRPACCKLSLSFSEWQRGLWESREIDVREIEGQTEKRGQERAGRSKMIFTAAIKAPLSWWIIICLTEGLENTKWTHSEPHICEQTCVCTFTHRLSAWQWLVCVCVWPPDTDCRTSCAGMLMFSKEINRERESERG